MEEEKINIEEDEKQIPDASEEKENTEENTSTEVENEPIDPLEAAKAEIEALKTQMLYKTAEFDNYRKRTLKEKAELILNGGEKAGLATWPILDDKERAVENGAKT